MMDDPNFGFVVAAYAIGFVVILSMIVIIVSDYVGLKRALSRLPENVSRESFEK
jgi:heme exporter protein D